MGIFKAYDIRGTVPDQLDASLARKIGYHFAQFTKAKRLVVGQDMRTHSPEITDAVSEGMRDAGCDVIRLGLASTPMTYYAIGSLDCDGGLCVTASHNPGEYNGMKLCSAGAKPISKATGIAEIEQRCKAAYAGPGSTRGKEEQVDVLNEYADHVIKFANLEREIHFGIDAANGMAGYTLGAILERLPKAKTETLYMEPDGTFPNHEANPLKEENLRDLAKLVRDKNCEFGVEFDGDADRCCFVDEKGQSVGADLMTALFAPRFLARFPGTPVVYDLRSSWAVKEEIQRAGGIPTRDRVGHSFMKATMREKGSQFGGELSGHFYFGENYTCDSGVIAMVTALSLVSAKENDGRAFSDLVANLRRYSSSGEVNFKVADKDEKIAELKRIYASGKQDELDGITVEFGDLSDSEWWWFNVRPSNTEPYLRLVLEASDAELCAAKREELVALLGTPV